MDEKIAWVLTHRYYDGSGFSVLRVYTDKERADEDLAVMQRIPHDGELLLHEVVVAGGEAW